MRRGRRWRHKYGGGDGQDGEGRMHKGSCRIKIAWPNCVNGKRSQETRMVNPCRDIEQKETYLSSILAARDDRHRNVNND